MRKLSNYIPAMKYGAKIHPEDIAGMIGLPYVGDIFYVDPSAGNDTANSGTSQNDALATVAAAFAKCTSGQHDVVIIAPTGGTGRTTETSAIDWNKRFTHLIGSAAPAQIAMRAGMDFSSNVVSPCFTLSEKGCIISNITFASGADINVMFNLTGSRNYIANCHIQGSTNATAGADAAWRALVLTGGEENVIQGCAIGIDTFTRSEANANLEMTGVCPRNKFIDCFFPIFGDDATATFVLISNNDAVQRYLIFEDCLFFNPVTGDSTNLTVGMTTTGAENGTIILRNCHIYGATDWASNYTSVYTSTPLPVGANAGFLLQVAT